MKGNEGIRQAIDEYQKRNKEYRDKKLDKMTDKAIDIINDGMNLDENDASLNYIKIMAKQLKIKISENHLVRMGYKCPERIELGGGTDDTLRIIIEGVDVSKFPSGK